MNLLNRPSDPYIQPSTTATRTNSRRPSTITLLMKLYKGMHPHGSNGARNVLPEPYSLLAQYYNASMLPLPWSLLLLRPPNVGWSRWLKDIHLHHQPVGCYGLAALLHVFSVRYQMPRRVIVLPEEFLLQDSGPQHPHIMFLADSLSHRLITGAKRQPTLSDLFPMLTLVLQFPQLPPQSMEQQTKDRARMLSCLWRTNSLKTKPLWAADTSTIHQTIKMSLPALRTTFTPRFENYITFGKYSPEMMMTIFHQPPNQSVSQSTYHQRWENQG